jgi:hypothetical protein
MKNANEEPFQLPKTRSPRKTLSSYKKGEEMNLSLKLTGDDAEREASFQNMVVAMKETRRLRAFARSRRSRRTLAAEQWRVLGFEL